MPWPERQRRAIFLNVKRRKGLGAAKRVMHEAGYGKGKRSPGPPVMDVNTTRMSLHGKKRKRSGKHHRELDALVKELRR